MDTTFKRVANITEVGTTTTPTVLSAAPTGIWVRVVVRNDGPVTVNLSLNPTDIPGDAFPLPSGTSEVVVLAPKQVLFGLGSGAGGTLAMMISEALPLGVK